MEACLGKLMLSCYSDGLKEEVSAQRQPAAPRPCCGGKKVANFSCGHRHLEELSGNLSIRGMAGALGQMRAGKQQGYSPWI